MKRILFSFCLLAVGCSLVESVAMRGLTVSAQFKNPMLFADVPDHDIILVGDTYYMVSTTMHFAPGCGIMKSKDLTNWEIVNYA